MRTAIIIIAGLVMLGVFALVASRFAGGMSSVVSSAKLFIAVWLVVALVNMWIGVSRAGYSIAEELPVFLVIFGIPAAAAAFVWWKYS